MDITEWTLKLLAISLAGRRWTTTVDEDSASGQPVLSVASTARFHVGQRILINPNGPRVEVGTVLSVQDGDNVKLEANLVYTHTATQGDKVRRC